MLTTHSCLRYAPSHVASGLRYISLVAISLVTPGITMHLTSDKAPMASPTRLISYMNIAFTVPSDWDELRSPGMLVMEPHAVAGAKTGTAITLEAFKGSTPKDPAIDHYYDGPWTTIRSDYGLSMKVGTKIKVLHQGKQVLLATEYVDITSENLGVGVSGFGSTVDSALATGRNVLKTSRRANDSPRPATRG